MNKMILFNVNERVTLSTKCNNPLFSEEIASVDEHSLGMFDISCTGSSVSKDQDMIAIGDYSGNLKIFTNTK